MTQDLLADLPMITEAASMPSTNTAVASTADKSAELAKVDLRAVALAQFGDWRADVAAARKTLAGVVHDVSTAAKLADVVTLRNRLIRTPRAEVRKVSKAVKSRLAAVSKDVGAEEDAAIAAYDDTEPLITPQIEAGQKALDDKQAERERVVAERDLKVKAELAGIVEFLEHASTTEGMTAERVGKGISMLQALTFGVDEWIDPVAAATVQAQTIGGMRQLQTTLAAREAAAAQMEALRLENERMVKLLADQQAALDAQAAALRAEQTRIAGLKARIAEIHAAATGHENATAADLYEAMVVITALDVSESQYREYTALAMAAQDTTLATLQGLHFNAVEHEEIEAARQRAVEPVAVHAAAEGKAETPEPDALEAAPITQDAKESGFCAGTPAVYASSAADSATAAPSGDEGTGAHADVSAPSPATEPMPQPAPAAAVMTHAAFLALVMSAFDCKFPSHPKPGPAWWAEVRAAGEALQRLGL